MYSGQNIIAKNLKFEKEYTDERGYIYTISENKF